MGNITLTRRFHAVGQGLFCSEVISKNEVPVHTVVYDCGCTNTKSSYEKYLNMEIGDLAKVLNPRKIIDILFVSHFHDDHISGIKALFNTFSIKKVVIPQVDEVSIADAFLYNPTATHHNQCMSVVAAFVTHDFRPLLDESTDSILRNEFSDPEVVEIPALSEEQSMDSYRSTVDRLRQITSQGVMYIPFNIEHNRSDNFRNDFNSNNRFKAFRDALVAKDMNKVKKLFCDSTFQKDIRDLYKAYFKDVNESSMPVLSCVCSPTFDKKTGKSSLKCQTSEECDSDVCVKNPLSLALKHGNCLYTGDYSVKIDKNDDIMLEFYKEFITNIGIIQAPHHGARNDNPRSLYKRLNGPVSVLSYGVGNNYGHPHPIAVCQMVRANSQIVPVSKKGETFIVSTKI